MGLVSTVCVKIGDFCALLEVCIQLSAIPAAGVVVVMIHNSQSSLLTIPGKNMLNLHFLKIYQF